MVGECRGKDKLYFDKASIIDSDLFQGSCRFPDLVRTVTTATKPSHESQDYYKGVETIIG